MHSLNVKTAIIAFCLENYVTHKFDTTSLD